MRAPPRCWPLILPLLLSCGEDFGVQEVTRFEMELEVPIVMRLPQADVPASPIRLDIPVSVPVEMDLLESLRAEGRADEADALEDRAEHIISVTLEGIDYEVAPNGIPADVDEVFIRMAPWGSEDALGQAWALGRTVAIPGERTIAQRELIYVTGALEKAGPSLKSMRFVLVADTKVHLAAETPLYARRLLLRLRLKLRVLLDLLT